MIFCLGPLAYDDQSCQATVNGKAIHLTPQNAVLLGLLMRVPRNPVCHQDIALALWPGSRPQPDALRREIHRLRKALAAAQSVELETVYRVGYRLTTTVDVWP